METGMAEEYRFDWQGQHGAAGRSFEGWLIPTLLSGADWDVVSGPLQEATKNWTDVLVTVQINGIEVGAREFFASIDRNLTYLIEREAKRLVEEDDRLTEIGEAAALFEADCKRAAKYRLGQIGIAFDEER